MEQIRIFVNEQFGELRTVEINDKIYYCATDVAKALGYSNPRDAVNRHCKGVVKHDGVSFTRNQHGVETKQTIEMSFIPEGDIYRLTARSKLPQAEKFELWVFDDVLPQIAHTGKYEVPKTPMDALELMFSAQKETIEKVDTLDHRLTEHEESQLLNPTQYGYIGGLVKSRLDEVKKSYDMQLSKTQHGILKHGINGDICRYMGVRTRTQIAQKSFEKVCQFVEGWNPSSVTLEQIKEIGASDE